MSIIEYLPKGNRSITLCESIAEAIYGTDEATRFSEEYVPDGGKVPSPKVKNFDSFLKSIPNCLWAIYNSEERNVVVGFVLISDMPHDNAIGFGINHKYARNGIMHKALCEILGSNSVACINFPLNAYTSKRNLAAISLLKSCSFIYSDEVNFMGEDSAKYIFNQKN